MSKKQIWPSSIRWSKEGKRLVRVLARKYGISESAVLEMAIRLLAEKEGVSRD